MDSTIAWSLNVRSLLTASWKSRICWSHGQYNNMVVECS